MTKHLTRQFTAHNVNSCFISELIAIIDTVHGHPLNIEAAHAKFDFAMTVDDDSSASNAEKPPDKVAPPLVPENDEPAVTDAVPLVFGRDIIPDSVTEPPTLVAEEPTFINMFPPTSLNSVDVPTVGIVDLPLTLLVDPTDVAMDLPAPVDQFPKNIDIRPQFPEVALPVENSKSSLDLPVPTLPLC